MTVRPDESELANGRFVERCRAMGLGVRIIDQFGKEQAPANSESAAEFDPAELRAAGLNCIERRRVTMELLEAGAAIAIPDQSSPRGGALVVAVPSARLVDDGDVGPWANLLSEMWRDLNEVDQARTAIAQFTENSTDLYRSLQFMVGASSTKAIINRPQSFLDYMANETRAVLGYRHLAIIIEPSMAETLAIEDPLVLSTGDDDRDCEDLIAAIIESWTEAQHETGAVLTTDGETAAIERLGLPIIVQPIVTRSFVAGAMIAAGKRGPDPDYESGEGRLLSSAAESIAIFFENRTLYSEQQSLFVGSVRALASAIDAKDPYTRGHSERVSWLGVEIARRLGMAGHNLEVVRISGLLHDVGKIGIPEAVLCKEGKLSDAEYEIVKRHPRVGFDILRDVPQLSPMLPGVLHHHERWDGRGYPSNLERDRIPRVARVLAVADAFDAMSSTRSYRPALSREEALSEIRTNAGVQFDPAMAAAMLDVDLTKYDLLLDLHRDSQRSAAA
ncbi:MAG: HD-GYP domain-containing protein [Phycisphaerales bacterium]